MSKGGEVWSSLVEDAQGVRPLIPCFSRVLIVSSSRVTKGARHQQFLQLSPGIVLLAPLDKMWLWPLLLLKNREDDMVTSWRSKINKGQLGCKQFRK
jgi:hypothetical protein